MKIVRFGSVLAAVSGLGLVGSALGSITAASLFETIPAGLAGSCAGNNLDTMVQEAATLTENAIAAIDLLLSGTLRKSGNNQRVALIANAIWGVQLEVPMIYLGMMFSVSAEDRQILETARGKCHQACQ
jgi:hypothetical protein